ncbi:T9SS type A sorting domain-containing protein [Hymenobacter sp. BT664]|uniref:T9SS type A sorting domain-containing protein n=1 Tax=Hymenobacter montanus TaxID=2771359 RepID=A0A927GJA6_9BACT|nr:choice-of-anchor Q domain-containing protein [Hymenobacter montanus]MBD2768293.1 T9SS type A sorting domain-containing protein [Hymenobacter montanus]
MKKYYLILFAILSGDLVTQAQTPICPAPPPITMTNPVSFGNGTPGSCTQAALQQLINAGGNIVCNCGPAPYTLTLTSTLQVPNVRVVIDGLNRLTISGGNTVRIFDKATAAGPGDATLLGLQNMILRDGFVVDNGTDDRLGGAAIRGRANGRLQVTNVQFINNVGPVLQSDACGAVHTVVYDDVSFVGCSFTNNRGANGGAVGTIGSAQRFINCLFENNQATGTGGTFDKGGIGGAVYVDGVDQNGVTNTMSLCGCQLRRNTANQQGGAAALIFYENKESTATIDRCTFEDNTVNSDGDLGGGLYYLNGPLTLTNSTFARNTTPGAGGGVWLTNTLLNVRNCTFTGNVTAGLGGGLAISGGAEKRANLLNTTFSANRAGNFGSAIFNIGTLTLGNSIFYNNLTGSANQSNAYAGGTINNGSELTVAAGNLQWPENFVVDGNTVREGWLTNDVLVADARLAPLANNGGPTPTQALPAGSPAINIGTAPGAPATDQRGAPRVGQPDAGAYEFGSTPLSTTSGGPLTTSGADRALLIFPNPASRSVRLVDASPKAATELFDGLGRMVRHYKPGAMTLDLSGLAAGLYVVRTADGRATQLVVREE